MESLSPNIFVNSMKETIQFYTVLGFTLIMTVPEGDQEEPDWAMMINHNVTFMFQTFKSLKNDLPEINRTNGGSLLFYIKVNEIRELFEKIHKHVTVIKEIEKTFYGATEFSIKDNNGYVLTFAEDE